MIQWFNYTIGLIIQWGRVLKYIYKKANKL